MKLRNFIKTSLRESLNDNAIKYFGKLSKKEVEWLINTGRKSYSGGELRPILYNNVMIGGISWNLGGIDYIELLPKFKNKGFLKYIVLDNIDDNNEVKFVTASDELKSKLSNYGDISYDPNTDITTVKINK